tara:strand:+ start:874 stop:1089 length:216 start_codon:yes stop_codon:yes gene_type:complete
MNGLQTNLVGARLKQNSLLRNDVSHEIVAVYSNEEDLWLVVRDENDGTLRRHRFKDVTVVQMAGQPVMFSD